jgi:plastocyanin
VTGRRLVLVLIVLGAIACGGSSPEPEACTDPVPAETVRLEDFAFEPDCMIAAPGASIRLENVGDTPHSFTVEGTDVSFDLAAGTNAEGSLSGVEPGRYAVTCVYHPQMTATLTVEGQ